MAAQTELERVLGELKACQRLAEKHYRELDRLNEENAGLRAQAKANTEVALQTEKRLSEQSLIIDRLKREQRALAEATHAFLARMEAANGIHDDEQASDQETSLGQQLHKHIPLFFVSVRTETGRAPSGDVTSR
jgi:hypothetical protein